MGRDRLRRNACVAPSRTSQAGPGVLLCSDRPCRPLCASTHAWHGRVTSSSGLGTLAIGCCLRSACPRRSLDYEPDPGLGEEGQVEHTSFMVNRWKTVGQPAASARVAQLGAPECVQPCGWGMPAGSSCRTPASGRAPSQQEPQQGH